MDLKINVIFKLNDKVNSTYSLFGPLNYIGLLNNWQFLVCY